MIFSSEKTVILHCYTLINIIFIFVNMYKNTCYYIIIIIINGCQIKKLLKFIDILGSKQNFLPLLFITNSTNHIKYTHI